MTAVTGTWNPKLSEVKSAARENNRPMLVMAGNSAGCGYCKTASAVFGQAAWKKYAKARGIPQFYADGSNKATRALNTELTREYSVVFWPTLLVFALKPSADLDAPSLQKVTDVELIGKFVFRKGRKINGITITLTVSNLTKILTSIYGTSHPEWLV